MRDRLFHRARGKRPRQSVHDVDSRVWDTAAQVLRTVSPRLWLRLYLLRQAERVVVPPGLLEADIASDQRAWWGCDGFEMHEDEQLERLEAWRAYGDLFSALRCDRLVNPLGMLGGPIANGWFPTPDAETYAAILASERPRRIVEVGGGFSTLIARRTVELLGIRETSLRVIDPEPRTDVKRAADEVVYARVEEVGLDRLRLEEPLLLFIDSSHVTRTGADVPFLFTKVIPRLASGSIVHVHDIALPQDYPPRFQARLYTEQYMLHALLIGAPRFHVMFASAYLGHAHPDVMGAVFGDKVPAVHGGLSFWFAVRR